jgi:hypothetical protein
MKEPPEFPAPSLNSPRHDAKPILVVTSIVSPPADRFSCPHPVRSAGGLHQTEKAPRENAGAFLRDASLKNSPTRLHSDDPLVQRAPCTSIKVRWSERGGAAQVIAPSQSGQFQRRFGSERTVCAEGWRDIGLRPAVHTNFWFISTSQPPPLRLHARCTGGVQGVYGGHPPLSGRIPKPPGRDCVCLPAGLERGGAL